MKDLNLKQLTLICLIGMFFFGFFAGMITGEYTQARYINSMINDSAQPLHVIQNEFGYFTVQRYNESCMTIECVNNSTIIKRG